MDIQQLLDSARLREKDVPLCLRGDLLVEWEAAEAAAARAEQEAKADGSLEAGGARQAAAAQVEAIRRQIVAESTTFRLRAVPRRRWTTLLAEHPPREDDTRDTVSGFNRDTFYDALVYECLIEPQMTEQQWQELADLLSSAQFDVLADAAWEVNRGYVDVPFLLAASQAPNGSGPASERPEDSASLSNGSTDGSRSPSTNTTTTGSSSRRGPKPSGTKNSKH